MSEDKAGAKDIPDMSVWQKLEEGDTRGYIRARGITACIGRLERGKGQKHGREQLLATTVIHRVLDTQILRRGSPF